jgi:hypothetical protein
VLNSGSPDDEHEAESFGTATSSAALGGRRDTLSAPIACVLLTHNCPGQCGPVAAQQTAALCAENW